MGVTMSGIRTVPSTGLATSTAAGKARVAQLPGVSATLQAVSLSDGPERDAVIAATSRRQPFPGNLVYRAAQRHIRAVGVYFRLEAANSA